MKFFKPITNTNITTPTMKAFYESRKIKDYAIDYYNTQIPYNENYYVCVELRSDKFIVVPMQNLATTSIKFFSLNGSNRISIGKNSSGNIFVQGHDSSDSVKMLNEIITAVYTISFVGGDL